MPLLVRDTTSEKWDKLWDERPKVEFYRVGPEEQPTQPAYPSYKMTPWLEALKDETDDEVSALKNKIADLKEAAFWMDVKLEAIKTHAKDFGWTTYDEIMKILQSSDTTTINPNSRGPPICPQHEQCLAEDNPTIHDCIFYLSFPLILPSFHPPRTWFRPLNFFNPNA